MTKADDHDRERWPLLWFASIPCWRAEVLDLQNSPQSEHALAKQIMPCVYRTKYIFMSICSISTALDNFTITILKETEAEMIFLATKQC